MSEPKVVIPEAAVEAAAKAIWQQTRVDPWEGASDSLNAEACRRDARAALEAAAPHMLGPDLYVNIPCSKCGEPNEQPVRL